MDDKIKVVIVDDHNIVADGVKSLLEKQEHYEVLGIINNGEELIHSALRFRADIIILDLNIPNVNGIEALKVLRRSSPHIKVVILTMYNDNSLIQKVEEAGASAYLLKNTDNTELLGTLRSVRNSNRFIRGSKLRKDPTENSKIYKDEFAKRFYLTPRELEILALIANEYSNQEIADQLFVSIQTVKTHRKSIIKKLGVKNSIGLVKLAIQNHLI